MKYRTPLAAGAAAVVAGAIAFTAPAGAAPVNIPAQDRAAQLRAASAADQLIAGQPDLFHRSDSDVMTRQSVIESMDLHYVAYERSHRGLPVVGGDFVVVTDRDANVLSTQVAQQRALAVSDITPAISASAATRVARAQVAKVDATSVPELKIVATGAGRTAYEVVVTGAKKDEHGLAPTKLHVFVDAESGKVLKGHTYDEVTHGAGNGYYSGQVELSTTPSFKLVDPKRAGIQCGGQNGAAFTKTSDSWGNGAGTDMETACVDAMYAAAKQWDMLKEWLDRDGANGQGRSYPMRVGLQQVNAFFNGSFTNFGHSSDKKRQVISMDVVAHEQGHGIFATTPGGSGGGNEAGGLNESTGDIFGALTEFYANNAKDKPDYEVGELVNLAGKGAIRYMYEPSKVGDPNCMWTGSAPEVHAGAGPQNHWFYLLAEGSNPTNGQPKSPTCNNSTVTGIGIEKAGKIFMATLNRKTSGWTHVKARNASIESAKQIFPGGQECKTVAAAWDAVSVKGSSC
ncbi:M4 family metallopeptidase [Pilimelia columellifera]|uniref:Neutral metalloproteinase n=1 Tax=Pilimelia columellifera subsp. columellifera TaxID=706583 RepID=A0ABP6AIM2_9ACTN